MAGRRRYAVHGFALVSQREGSLMGRSRMVPRGGAVRRGASEVRRERRWQTQLARSAVQREPHAADLLCAALDRGDDAEFWRMFEELEQNSRPDKP